MMSIPSSFWTSVRPWLRQHRSFFLWLALVGFMGGFFVFRFGELQVGWFMTLGVLPLLVSYRKRVGHILTSQPLPAVVLGGAALMLVTSIIMLDDPLPDRGQVFEALLNLVLLTAFFAIPPLAISRRKHRLSRLLKAVVITAAVATLVSFVVHYGVRNAAFPVDRFMNVLVYSDGLNPVLTGLSCGFAAVLALGIARREESRTGFWLWWGMAILLMAGVFYSGSRSAIIATVAGTTVMVLTGPKNKRWRLAAPLLLMAVIYGTGLVGASSRPLGPVLELVKRGDSGRMAIYSAISKRMVDPGHVFLGHGLWAAEALPPEEAGALAFHAHSMYASTFYHSGLLGAVWLFAVLGLGLERAWSVWWRSGDAVWLALLAFGMVGLMCDGTMPFRVMTITRIEPLLILFPLAVSSAMATTLERNRRREEYRRSPSVEVPSLDDAVPVPVRIRLERKGEM